MKHFSNAVAGSHYSEAVSNRGQRPRLTTLAKISAWMAVPCIILLLTACGTSKHIQTIPIETIKEVTRTDTLHINNVQYDSIYISQDKFIDRTKDTILIRQHDVEYRYKFLRDTIEHIKLEVRHDSIPYEVRITEFKEVQHFPPWCKWLSVIGGIAVLILVSYIVVKLRKSYNSFP